MVVRLVGWFQQGFTGAAGPFSAAASARDLPREEGRLSPVDVTATTALLREAVSKPLRNDALSNGYPTPDRGSFDTHSLRHDRTTDRSRDCLAQPAITGRTF